MSCLGKQEKIPSFQGIQPLATPAVVVPWKNGIRDPKYPGNCSPSAGMELNQLPMDTIGMRIFPELGFSSNFPQRAQESWETLNSQRLSQGITLWDAQFQWEELPVLVENGAGSHGKRNPNFPKFHGMGISGSGIPGVPMALNVGFSLDLSTWGANPELQGIPWDLENPDVLLGCTKDQGGIPGILLGLTPGSALGSSWDQPWDHPWDQPWIQPWDRSGFISQSALGFPWGD